MRNDHGTPLPSDLNVPGHRQRGFPLLGLVRVDQHTHGRAFFDHGLTSPPLN